MEPHEELYGEYPPNLEQMPGAIKVDDVAHKALLEHEAAQYLAKFPQIKLAAQRLGKDLVAFASAHGKEILVGVGVASAVTGGVILYRHPPRKRKRSRKK